MSSSPLFFKGRLTIALGVLLCSKYALGQRAQEQGHPIGSVTTNGNLIVMELSEGALGKENLFDLTKRSLRFRPDKSGYRGETLPLEWDPEFGPEQKEPEVMLHN